MENNRYKYRINFQKTGRLRFIGHLDLLNLFHRSLKRSGLAVAYSKGFNPHQQTSFALPLSLGYYGLNECVDIVFTEDIPGAVIVARLNENMPKGVLILDARKLDTGEKTAASVVAAASYKADIPRGTAITPAEFDRFAAQSSVMIMKKTKKNAVRTDIKSHILELTPSYIKGELSSLFMLLAAGPQKSVRADSVVSALFEFCAKDYNPYKVTYSRENLYKSGNSGLTGL